MTDFRLHRTHISSLLFAGDQVFKFKRPVKLPFADFSTRALRERFCAEELRLNRRTAPALYRGVVSIGGEPAVWMRRFDDTQLFDALARDGRLDAAHVDALAATLAAFQAGLPPCTTGFDAAAVAARWSAANLREIQVLPGLDLPAGRVTDLVAWDAAQAATHAPLMRARQAAGRVVEGHGDLHLANIVWHDGAPLLFDALEFEPELRWGDRIADPAFTFMDLLDHGLPGLAWRFISAWCEAGGDHDALPLLRWQAAYRAAVRAKVAALQGQPEAAARRMALARRLAAAPPPTLWITSGLSGSGKSSAALQLVERAGAVRVRSDVERKRLHGLAPTARPADPAQIYGADSTARTYSRLGALAAAGLAGGVSMVVDAACLRRIERDALRRVAGQAGAACRLLVIDAPNATLRERIGCRLRDGADPSDADTAVLELQLRMQQPVADDEAAVRIDASGTPASVAAQLQALVARID
jgi:aminoglycoside phosphotransferase family enzyme/predicted kinase